MRLVVADTGPLNYLVLIGEIEILPKLFELICVPEAVCVELRHRDAPSAVRRWAERPPAWLDVRPIPAGAEADPAWQELDDGERAALELACAGRRVLPFNTADFVRFEVEAIRSAAVSV